MHHSTDRIGHTMAFVIPVMEHWLERQISQWVHHKGLIQQPMSRCSTMELHVAPAIFNGPMGMSKIYYINYFPERYPQHISKVSLCILDSLLNLLTIELFW